MGEGQFFTACRYSDSGARLYTRRCANLAEFLADLDRLRNDIGHWPQLRKLEPIFARPASEPEASRVRQIACRCSGVMTAPGEADYSYAGVFWEPGEVAVRLSDYTERLAALRDLRCDDRAADEEFDRVARMIFGGTLDDIDVSDDAWDGWRAASDETWSVQKCRAVGYDLTLTGAMEVVDAENFRLLVRATAEHLLKHKGGPDVFAVESRPLTETCRSAIRQES